MSIGGALCDNRLEPAEDVDMGAWLEWICDNIEQRRLQISQLTDQHCCGAPESALDVSKSL
jgi:hypothetical protein